MGEPADFSSDDPSHSSHHLILQYVLVSLGIVLIAFLSIGVAVCCGLRDRRRDRRQNAEGNAAQPPPPTRGLDDEEFDSLPRVSYPPPLNKFNETRCSICIDNFVDGDVLTELPCGHLFHRECISQFVKGLAWCPNCRAHINDANSA